MEVAVINIVSTLATELDLSPTSVSHAVDLLDQGNTIPFIARYRKEATGRMDENNLRRLNNRLQQLRSLQERKDFVRRQIDRKRDGGLNTELEAAIDQATSLQEVNDIYRPFKPKRQTRAAKARAKGLEPLAELLWNQPADLSDKAALHQQASHFIDQDKGVESVSAALTGASDLIAQRIADEPRFRQQARQWTWEQADLVCQKKDEADDRTYEMYFDYREPVKKLPSHRLLAINRAETNGVISTKIEAPGSKMVQWLKQNILSEICSGAVKHFLEASIEDAYQRLLAPAVDRDLRRRLTEEAEAHALDIFAKNLRSLLLQPPVRDRVILGIDPAYRTGCKLAVIDAQGEPLAIDVIYPTPPRSETEAAHSKLVSHIETHGVDLIAIGNGTASRETEQFVARVLDDCSGKAAFENIAYTIVSEAGASVYSASPLAQTEFPGLDVTERSAISIARRLQDPLAELVKIEPKSLGVGQYQHDVNQHRLSDALEAVVESCVNDVGVNLNTASEALLQRVAGIGPSLAQALVAHRQDHGSFTQREQLQRVHGIGPKTFQQCAGFLRIPEGDNPLDRTGIHPESYPAARELIRQLGANADTLRRGGIVNARQRAASFGFEQLLSSFDVGRPTLDDILHALEKPGRDPRHDLPGPIFRTDVLQMDDLETGMVLPGTVRNVVDFGAFVDIGVKQDGLVHISELSHRYVHHPTEVVSAGDPVYVTVTDIDRERERISLSIKR